VRHRGLGPQCVTRVNWTICHSRRKFRQRIKRPHIFTVFADAQNAKSVLFVLSRRNLENSGICDNSDLTNEPDGRLPESYKVLSAKKVGIVGGGSLGSKICGQLGARSGCRRISLSVDDDIRQTRQSHAARTRTSLAWVPTRLTLLRRAFSRLAQNVKVDAYRTALVARNHRDLPLSNSGRDSPKCDLLIDADRRPTGIQLCGVSCRIRQKSN